MPSTTVRAHARRTARGGTSVVRHNRARGATKHSLFTGIYPGGIVYADRGVEKSGDYKRVAFLPYDTLKLEVYAPRSPLLPEVRASAAKIQARRGERFAISASDQYVVLGAK